MPDPIILGLGTSSSILGHLTAGPLSSSVEMNPAEPMSLSSLSSAAPGYPIVQACGEDTMTAVYDGS